MPVRGGLIKPSEFTLPIELMDYLTDRARVSAEIAAKIPAHQVEKIGKIVANDPERVARSDQFAVMMSDARMFGLDAILRKQAKD